MSQPKSESVSNLKSFGETFYHRIYIFGVYVMRAVLRACRRIRGWLHSPVMFVKFCCRVVSVYFKHIADSHLFKDYRSFIESLWDLHHHAKRSYVNVKKAVNESPEKLVKVLKILFNKAIQNNRVVFVSVFNYALPLAALVVFAVTVSYWNNVTFALEVQYNNQNVGYISEESVLTDAENMAQSLIMNNSSVKENKETVNTSSNSESEQAVFLSDEKDSQENVISTPTFRLARVSVDKLSDADSLCDRLLESAQTGVTHACGVYVDGEFICAVKNETDAQQVFDTILEEYPHEPNTMTDFVEEIELIQGLYGDNDETIWNAEKLREKLNGTKSAAVYYVVQEGDTPSGIATANDLTTAQLVAMNPWVEEVIHVGDRVLISNQVKFLQVKVMKTVHRNVEIPYSTVQRENSKMFAGSRRITREGQNGVKQVTELVTYVNNVVVGTKQLSEKVITEPVSAQMDVGTKSTNMSGSYGNYSVSPVGTGFVWPVIGVHRVSAHYGRYRWGGRHWGVDIAGPGANGSKIVAVQSGTVTYAGWDSTGHGYRVIINHGGGLETCYSHTKKGSITVKVGQHVEQGQVIARVGQTGNATGPHLHFEVHVNGRKVNPEPYIGL